MFSILASLCALNEGYRTTVLRSARYVLGPLKSLNAKWISVQVEEETKGLSRFNSNAWQHVIRDNISETLTNMHRYRSSNST